jgi:hypothetical protein
MALTPVIRKRQFSTVVDRLNVGQVPAAEGI